MREFITHSPLLTGDNVEKKREEILNYFIKTYELYEKLFELLRDDSIYYKRPEMLRHPLIFYFGHTATFYINKLNIAKILKTRINSHFESIFAIGVDEMSWDDLNEDNYNWPSVDEVRKYRAKVKEVIIETIKNLPLNLPINWDEAFWAILMGIEHEKIHLETSSVLIRQLDIKDVVKSEFWKICDEVGNAPQNELLKVEGEIVTLGKSFDSPLYGWDNEYGKLETKVDSFNASKYLVSNGEFLEFVNDGGYQKLEFWEEEGKKWLTYKKVTHPTFWVKDGNNYKYRAMAEIIDMPLNWPVDVNYHEAKAFCNYKSKKLNKSLRLPTEVEWHLLREICEIEDEPYWQKAPANINLEYFASACPVDKFKMGKFYDVIGNVWQWSETPIDGFDGFRVHYLYDDFSTPTFDNRHNLIKGGSWISTGNEAIKDSRYAFRRHFYQHTGFRYIESNIKIEIEDNLYENDIEVADECEYHYGEEYFSAPNFAKKSAEICLKYANDKKRALDLGCSVGRCSFELAKEFEFVNGIDFSARFLKLAYQMQERGEVKYIINDEGKLNTYKNKKLNEFGLNKTKNRVEFFQGDGTNLKPQFNSYDLIFINDLLDKIHSPKKLLTIIHERLNIDGILVIASSYDFSKVKREEWLGGFKDENGETLTVRDGIDKVLSTNFERVEKPFDIEAIFRETKRKYQHKIFEFNIYKRIK